MLMKEDLGAGWLLLAASFLGLKQRSRAHPLATELICGWMRVWGYSWKASLSSQIDFQ